MFPIKHLLNKEIKVAKVRIAGEQGLSDIISLCEAQKQAEEQELDLVLLSEKDGVGVCKIFDYQKYEYTRHKKEKSNHKCKHEVKEIQIRPSIAIHDMKVKAKAIDKFLKAKCKVKISLIYKGREMKLMSKGEDKLNELLSLVTEEYKVSSQLSRENNRITIGLEAHK